MARTYNQWKTSRSGLVAHQRSSNNNVLTSGFVTEVRKACVGSALLWTRHATETFPSPIRTNAFEKPTDQSGLKLRTGSFTNSFRALWSIIWLASSTGTGGFEKPWNLLGSATGRRLRNTSRIFEILKNSNLHALFKRYQDEDLTVKVLQQKWRYLSTWGILLNPNKKPEEHVFASIKQLPKIENGYWDRDKSDF